MLYSDKNIKRSVVRIQGVFRGTGFWVKGKDNKIYILTCTHVIGEDKTEASFRVYDGTSDDYPIKDRKATVINKPVAIESGDIALLEVAEADIPHDCLPLRLLDLVFDEDTPSIRSFGFPGDFSAHGRHLADDEARLGSLTRNDDDVLLYQLQNAGDIRGGFSGAPIVHTDWGFVLGVISEVERPDHDSLVSVAYAIPVTVVATHFADYLEVQTLHPYKAWLSSLYDDVVLNDEKGMRLSDIYVEPYYGIHQKCKPELFEAAEHNRQGNFIHVNTSIHSAIDKVIEERDRPLLLLLGFPGQGKTSLVKRLLRDHIDRNIYLVRLRDVADPRRLRDDPSEILLQEVSRLAKRAEGIILPLPNLKDALFILDGLDELSMQSDMKGEDVDAIVRGIRDWARRDSIQVVLTSRYVVDTDRLADTHIWCWQLAELQPEQQDQWLERYRLRHPESHLTPALLHQYREEDNALSELITQPILLHLVASLEETLSETVNRAAIYGKLFDQLIKRPWAKKDEGNIPLLEGLTPTDLREAVQDMAHAIFHSDKLYLHKSKLETLPKVKALQDRLQGKLDLWRTVMVAFYMEEVRKKDRYEEEKDRNHDYAIEFLHKSLPEYLCAEKIWRDIKDKFADKPRRATNDLADLHEIFQHRLLTNVVTEYLIGIIKNDVEVDKTALHKRLCYHLPEFLETDFLDPGKVYSRPLDTIRSVFYGWWTVVSHLKEKESVLNADNQHALVMLFKVVSSRQSTYTNLSFSNLDGANLSGLALSNLNLSGASLIHADLSGAFLPAHDFSNSILIGANLADATLFLADFSGANLAIATLSRANLSEANLVGANLSGADFSRTNLSGADFSGADFSSSILVGITLPGADLSYANLDGAENLTIEQLQSTRSLYKCNGISRALKKQLIKKQPQLFEKPK